MQRSGKGFSALLILLFISSCLSGGGKVALKKASTLQFKGVRDKIKNVQPEFELCYLTAIRKRKIFYGKLLLTVVIDRMGRVREMIWKPEPPAVFKKCAEDVVKRIDFGKLPDEVRIEVPLKFSLEMEEIR